MKKAEKVLLSLITVAAATAGAAYIIKRWLDAQPMPITEAAVKRKDTLTLAEVVDYFKSLKLDNTHETPFLCTDLAHFNVKKSVIPDADDNVLFIGVFQDGSDNITNYALVYSRNYDEALKNVLAKATNGIVTLS